jgi:hypothetical protein
VRLTTYHHIAPMSRNLGTLTLLDPSGPAWPVMGVLYLYLLQGAVALVMTVHCVYLAITQKRLCLVAQLFKYQAVVTETIMVLLRSSRQIPE